MAKNENSTMLESARYRKNWNLPDDYPIPFENFDQSMKLGREASVANREAWGRQGIPDIPTGPSMDAPLPKELPTGIKDLYVGENQKTIGGAFNSAYDTASKGVENIVNKGLIGGIPANLKLVQDAVAKPVGAMLYGKEGMGSASPSIPVPAPAKAPAPATPSVPAPSELKDGEYFAMAGKNPANIRTNTAGATAEQRKLPDAGLLRDPLSKPRSNQMIENAINASTSTGG